MVLKHMLTSPVSTQYLREDKINVTIIEVKSPAHYVIKESPTVSKSSDAVKFVELEESMQKFYGSLEHSFYQLPVKDTVLVVKHDGMFYRAKVCSILYLTQSFLIKVYLLDYGKECTVPKSSIFAMLPDFMSVPFQVVDFKLLGLDPISLVVNSDLSVDYGHATDWDPSATTHIKNILKEMKTAHVKIEGANKDCVFGSLHVTVCSEEEICINVELLSKKFAKENPECWNDITKRDEILNDPEFQKRSVALGHEPVQHFKSRVEGTAEEQNKAMSSEKQSELLSQSGIEQNVSLDEKATAETSENASRLLEIVKIASGVQPDTMQDVEKHSPEKELVTRKHLLTTTDKDPQSTSEDAELEIKKVKSEQSVSTSPNAFNLIRFKQIACYKKHDTTKAAEQQSISQTKLDMQEQSDHDSCSPPHTSQSRHTIIPKECISKLEESSLSITTCRESASPTLQNDETEDNFQLATPEIEEKMEFEPTLSELPENEDDAEHKAFCDKIFARVLAIHQANVDRLQGNSRLKPEETAPPPKTSQSHADDSAASVVQVDTEVGNPRCSNSGRNPAAGCGPREIPTADPSRIIALYQRHKKLRSMTENEPELDEDEDREKPANSSEREALWLKLLEDSETSLRLIDSEDEIVMEPGLDVSRSNDG